MTFEKFCWLLETSKLYHTRLDQFNDPFEGAVTFAYAKMRDSGEIKPHFSLREFEPWNFKLGRLNQFATCWHASEHESDALWQLYAPGGAGVAIVSSMNRIEKSVDLTSYWYGLLGEVEYVDFETHNMLRSGIPTVIRPGYLKRKSFEYEREVRGIIATNLITDCSAITLDEAFIDKQRKEQPVGITPQVDLKTLIQSIVVSPVAASYVEELVRKLSERRGLENLITKSKLLQQPVY